MYFLSSLILKATAKWITWAIWFMATIICTTIFLLTRYTNINVLEKDGCLFEKSPSQTEMGINSTIFKQHTKVNNKMKTNRMDADINEQYENGAPDASAFVLHNEFTPKPTIANNMQI